MRGEERRLAALVALAVAFLALMLWLVRREEPTHVAELERAHEHMVVATAEPARPVSLPPAPAAFAPADQLDRIEPPAAPPITLPPDTQPLAAEFVPGTTEWEEVPLLEDGAQVLRFLPAKYNVIAPAPIVLYLEVVDTASGKRVALESPKARVRPFDDPDGWIDVPLVDDGSHHYVGTLRPSAAQQDRLRGHVVAEGIVQTREAGVRRIPQALIYTRGPRAHLTGQWRDERRDGHLWLTAEIEVDEPGQFTLMAELFGPAQQPIALVRAMGHLDRGTQSMTMRVWGKALRDAGVDGPYEVRDVLLTRDNIERGDYDPGPTIGLAHRTQAYRAADFSPDPYVEPSVPRVEVGPSPHDPPPLHPDSERPSRRAGSH